jgi:uncharacterized metal-binding protein YceD (DUF177 family)
MRRYLPGAAADAGAEVVIAPDEEEPPEALSGEAIDLAAAVTEELILALDPYPRAPGAALSETPPSAPDRCSPFAVLERLKRKS